VEYGEGICAGYVNEPTDTPELTPVPTTSP
jgi:hypothetical protein